MRHEKDVDQLRRDTAHSYLTRSNRLVVERVSIDAVTLRDRLVKRIGKRAIASTKANLEKYGQVSPIIVSDTLQVVHGEEFLVAAKELGLTHVDVIRLSELSETDQRIVSLFLKKLPALSTWDEDALRVEFTELQALDLDIDVGDFTGFSMGEIDVILNPSEEKSTRSIKCQIPCRAAKSSRKQVIYGRLESIVSFVVTH